MNKRLILTIFVLFLTLSASRADAFWMWTPETNKWENPKYSVKDTPQEQLEHGLGFFEAEAYPEAMREFRKLIKHYPKAREAPDAQYYIARSIEQTAGQFDAFKAYQLVIDKYPFSERSAAIVQKQLELGEKLLEAERNQNKFIDAFTGTDYNVIEVFRSVIKNAPYGKSAPYAQYKIAEYLLENKVYQEARDEFEKVINDYPESEWAKAARFQIATSDANRSAEAQYDQKITEVAVDEFEDFVDNYPETELSLKAKKQILVLREKEAENNFLIAQFYEKQKNYSSAKIYYQVVVNDYRNTAWAKKALEKIQEFSDKIQ